MKKAILTTFVIFSIIMGCTKSSDLQDVYSPILKLENFDYFEEDIPFRLTAYSRKANNDNIAALGRVLFYDARLSQNNSISCASCHRQEQAFADGQQFSSGLKNIKTTRNAMALSNNAYQISHFWEGNSGQLEDHILNPISNHIEMGMRSSEELVEKLKEVSNYTELFDQVYEQPINKELIADALATFVASIVSYNSKFDKGKERNFTNFTSHELAGKDLFFDKAKCGNCHGGDHYSASWRRATNIGLDMDYEDEGAGNGAFKVPSLRNIALTAPYMHDGRFETLEEVVNHYVGGVEDHPNLDWALRSKIDLTELEKEQLIAFLHTLTDYELLTEQKFSNPF